ncbi:MAG: hypothetical protein HY815_29600, partial [Candidatus Riflebacteria bacterium]|nr:hypothetical protein [Candidatus Riflebacteria bacterium]
EHPSALPASGGGATTAPAPAAERSDGRTGELAGASRSYRRERRSRPTANPFGRDAGRSTPEASAPPPAPPPVRNGLAHSARVGLLLGVLVLAFAASNMPLDGAFMPAANVRRLDIRLAPGSVGLKIDADGPCYAAVDVRLAGAPSIRLTSLRRKLAHAFERLPVVGGKAYQVQVFLFDGSGTFPEDEPPSDVRWIRVPRARFAPVAPVAPPAHAFKEGPSPSGRPASRPPIRRPGPIVTAGAPAAAVTPPSTPVLPSTATTPENFPGRLRLFCTIQQALLREKSAADLPLPTSEWEAVQSLFAENPQLACERLDVDFVILASSESR